jgi:DNA-binding LytR/AlgR family response regulator
MSCASVSMKSDVTSPLSAEMPMNLSQKLNSPFPYYLNDDRKNTLLALAIGMFVILFHVVYKTPGNPGINLTFAQKSLFGGVTFAVLFIHIVLIPNIFTFSFVDSLHWTVKKYILHVLWICFVIACVNAAIDKFYICPDKPLAEIIPHVLQQIALTGIIPIAIMTLLFKNNLLQQNLKSAIGANQEISKIKDLKSEVSKSSNSSITIYSDTSETLTFKLPDLLFIEADDNYSTVVWKNGHGIEKKLLRINLKNIETQLNNTYAIRCHRSYIVNVHAIANITGNTNGYKLQIRDSDFSIPVSRPKGKELIDKIHQLRNMMELY